MIFVEDALVAIRNKLLFQPQCFTTLLNDTWYQSFITSVAAQCDAGRRLSTNQSRIVLKIIQRVSSALIGYHIATEGDVEQLLSNPQYRLELYESAPRVPSEVRYLGNNLLGFRCKADEHLTTKIQEAGVLVEHIHSSYPTYRAYHVRSRSRFNWALKIWIVPVYSSNLATIRRLISDHFQTDQSVRDYLNLCEHSIDVCSTAILLDDDPPILVANICDNALLADWMTAIAGGIVL